MKSKYFLTALLLVISMTGSVSAEEESFLNPQQEDAVRNFAATVLEPPNVIFKATLKPPATTYSVNIAKEDYAELNERVSEIFEATDYKNLSQAYIQPSWTLPFVKTWEPSLSCGTWGASNLLGAKQWNHPDTQPGGCSHDQGTSHPGTIVAKGDYSIALNSRNKHGENVEVLAVSISFTCRYEGSESGTGQCEETITKWAGRYAPVQPETITYEEIAIMTIVVIGGIVVGIVLWIRRRKK